MTRRYWLIVLACLAVTLLLFWRVDVLTQHIARLYRYTSTTMQRHEPQQYLRIVPTHASDRTILVYRSPGESMEAWLSRARDLVDGKVSLDGDGLVEEKTTVWVSGGITFQLVTRRGEDEDMEKWCARHDEAVKAAQDEFPPRS